MSDREQQLRDMAYQLWLSEGEPHGRDRDHWEQAERDLATADDAEAVNAPVTEQASTPVEAAAVPAPKPSVDVPRKPSKPRTQRKKPGSAA